MRMFDVQGVEINAARERVFEFLKDPSTLPQWARAFVSAESGRARLETPAGTVNVWSVGIAQSRVTETTPGTCIDSLVLHGPPVALEQVEGALEVQRSILRSELATLKALMERD